MGKLVSPALEALADNLVAAQSAGKFTSVQALGSAAKKDEKTIRRILKKENEPALDTVSEIAKVIGVEPWELIKPAGVGTTLAHALEVVAKALDTMPEPAREVAAQHLQTLARAPDSKKAMTSLLQALTPTETAADALRDAAIAPHLQEEARRRHQEAMREATQVPDDGKKRYSA